jgi:lantibiotic modifying enzyme
VRYLEAAERTGDWLLATAERGPQGWCWPVRPGVSAEVGPGLGWGTAAPVMFFVEAFRTTGDERWLLAAREGVRWMDAHLDAAAAGWAGCGLLTGIGGWAVVLHELAAAARDEHASSLARRVLVTVADHASVTDNGVHWHDLTEMVWGTAGVGCLMLTLGADYLGPPAVDLAVRAGDWLLTQAEVAGGYPVVPGPGARGRVP